MENTIDITVVVPLYNEAESLPELYAWIKPVSYTHLTLPTNSRV